MDSDKVMVLDAGRLIEFDEPYILLQKEGSAFTRMVKETDARLSCLHAFKISLTRLWFSVKMNVVSRGEVPGVSGVCLEIIVVRRSFWSQ
ncbi:probable multidrug resistance-associated protein lethal(2)03659 [Acanthaster planci]|uniref:Probable multidrug resistance-associated protein lethal(2)03659 n=1 Tax=Acanthaster planci TaxID=133434 RepID=A0A8B7YLV0_ACAPL|nr:probable multidrug resistance-associated protein lethal(2)03659 [Acanthaster planci]